MTDSFGNDIAAVFVPVTGAIGFAPGSTALPSGEDLSAPDFTLPAAFKKLGLLTEDGGPEWTLEKDGDPIEFFQEGYSIPSGLANALCVAKLAQTDANTQLVVFGETPDANNYIEIDAGGHSLEFAIYTEEISKNGDIRRRVGYAGVDGAKEDKSERGSVKGYETTFKFRRDESLHNKHIGQAIIKAA
jgi:hypothetical protein